MIKRLKPISEFRQNALILMTGTAISQAIPVAITPILTRIYTPEDFGTFALYLSLLTIFSVFATARYEMAIILPAKDEDAFSLLLVSSFLSLIVGCMLFLLVFIYNTEITEILGNSSISFWLYLLPFSVVLSGLYNSLNAWHNRLKGYGHIAKVRIIQSGSVAGSNIFLSFILSGPIGLILGNFIGLLVSTFLFFLKIFRSPLKVKLSFEVIKQSIERYKKFPYFDLPASFLNISSHQSFHIFFNIFFGAVTSGYYFLVQRIFGLPIAVFSNSIQDVFKEKVSKVHNVNGNTREIFVRVLRKLILIAVLPALLLFVFSIDIIVFIFGADWVVAGKYLQILLPAFFLRFITFPLSYMMYIVEKQQVNLVAQALLFISIILIFMGPSLLLK